MPNIAVTTVVIIYVYIVSTLYAFKLGGIHKRRHQIFVIFDTPPPFVIKRLFL